MWTWLLNNIGLVVSILAFIVTIVYTVIKLKRQGVSTIDILKGVADAVKHFPEYIRLAEKVSTDAEEKKTFVLDLFMLSCKAKGFVPTEEILADVSKQIDDMVQLSKDINLHSKSNVKEDTKATASEDIPETINTVKPIEIKPIQKLGGDNNAN